MARPSVLTDEQRKERKRDNLQRWRETWRQYVNETEQQRRQALADAGLCVQCGRPNTGARGKRCPKCADANAERERERRAGKRG
jgi:hypothetical protein